MYRVGRLLLQERKEKWKLKLSGKCKLWVIFCSYRTQGQVENFDYAAARCSYVYTTPPSASLHIKETTHVYTADIPSSLAFHTSITLGV